LLRWVNLSSDDFARLLVHIWNLLFNSGLILKLFISKSSLYRIRFELSGSCKLLNLISISKCLETLQDFFLFKPASPWPKVHFGIKLKLGSAHIWHCFKVFKVEIIASALFLDIYNAEIAEIVELWLFKRFIIFKSYCVLWRFLVEIVEVHRRVIVQVGEV
jgi:hypothetical protein